MDNMERRFKPLDALHDADLCLPVLTTAVGIFEYLTATESKSSLSSTGVGIASTVDCEPSPSDFVSSRIERMMRVRSEYASAVEFEIEASKAHWSELDPTSDEDEEDFETDLEVFERLRKKWGSRFFKYCSDESVVGEKIAEGGQAEIFRAEWRFYDGSNWPCVLKVFKEGFSLRDLEKQWPEGMFQNRKDSDHAYWTAKSCPIHGATLLKSGRFAFQLMKYWGDLRKLIDFRMQHNHNRSPPFTNEEVGKIVVSIAEGMEALHKDNIIHRDLKASNVLISDIFTTTFDPILDKFLVVVADFECSVGVVGTRYWRAPEILHAIKNCDIKPQLFTEKSDVYSFAMTCYEVLTGCIPFDDLDGPCYGIVIDGKRPKLPNHVDPWLKTLVNRCWHMNPLERPSFTDIVNQLKKMYFD